MKYSTSRRSIEWDNKAVLFGLHSSHGTDLGDVNCWHSIDHAMCFA